MSQDELPSKKSHVCETFVLSQQKKNRIRCFSVLLVGVNLLHKNQENKTIAQ